jgi:uncharacterized protein YndB with AHSA1/START domain
MAQKITVQTTVPAPLEKVWEYFTNPEHVVAWNNASDDWFTPKAENDLRSGGSFKYRMEAKDGSNGFDFGGTYDEVTPLQHLAYTMDDGRKVEVSFSEMEGETHVTETFDAENQNPVEVQQNGWQAILNHFKVYVASH